MTPLIRQLYLLAPFPIKEAMVAARAWRLRALRRPAGYQPPARYAFAGYASLSQAELRCRQLERLQVLVSSAQSNCPFYGPRLPESIGRLEDLERVPVLRKAEAREHYHEIMARDARPRDAFRDSTSGTTGSPLHFAVGLIGLRERFAIVDGFLSHVGYPPAARSARFGAQWVVPMSRSRPPFWVHNRVDDQLLMSAYHLHDAYYGHYAEALDRFRPVYSSGYAHTQYLLARYLATHGGLAHPLRAVLTESEYLPPHEHDMIERGFGAPCYDTYGLREMNWLAIQCQHRRYHCLQLTSLIEVVDEEGRAMPMGVGGRILATDLTQGAFPFIRYDTGDTGALSDEECPCGWHSQVLLSLDGRAEDTIITPEGRTIVGILPWEAKHTVEGQVAQTHADRVAVRVVPEPGFAPQDMAGLLATARTLLGPRMRVELEVVASIPRTMSNKFKHIVREWRGAPGKG